MDRMLSVDDVAKIMGCCRTTAYNMMHQMPHFVPPGSGTHKLIRVWERDLNAFIMSNTIIPAAPQAKGSRKAAPATRAAVLDSELFEPDGRIKRRRA